MNQTKMTDRHKSILRFALHLFIRFANERAIDAAQDLKKARYNHPVKAMEMFLQDAKDAEEVSAMLSEECLEDANSIPIDMVLYCPKCNTQHIDEPETPKNEKLSYTENVDGVRHAIIPEPRTALWTNPPHRSHLCLKCGHVWRPADVATNGVASIKTKGKKDSPKIDRPAKRTLQNAMVSYVRSISKGNLQLDFISGRSPSFDAERGDTTISIHGGTREEREELFKLASAYRSGWHDSENSK